MSECPICYEEIETHKYTTMCGHDFHLFCLLKWVREHQNCPMCRSEIIYVYVRILPNINT